MPVAPPKPRSRVAAILWVVLGAVLAIGAWLVPVNLSSVPTALLRAAGAETAQVSDYGRQLVEREKLGPAALFLAAAKRAGDPHVSRLSEALAQTSARQPEFVPWGGWDPFLDPLFNVNENTGRKESTPVLSFFIAEKARVALRNYLKNSRSLGVQAVMKTRDITLTTRFVPVGQAGGQSLDAVVLLAALLYQGEHLAPPLQRELRSLAESASARMDMGPLEDVYLDLLSLGKRLDWVQLSELLRRTNDTQALHEYAHLARVAPDDFSLIYAAALFSGSADQAAAYLIKFGKTGLEDLATATRYGQGAVQLLLQRQVPVSRSQDLALPDLGQAALLHPKITLIAKWAAFSLGAFAILRGLTVLLFAGPTAPARQDVTSVVLAALCAALFILFTEPYLLKSAPKSEFAFTLAVPVLATLNDPASLTSVEPTLAMDTATLLSIGLFALLQIGWYFVCLSKIAEISRTGLPPLVRLRLMENEENLFDGGLYLGIAGTATALVLQVLGVVQPNLLAAYSSNLFGIVCVALIKIRHVRAFKRSLILESQATAVPPATAANQI